MSSPCHECMMRELHCHDRCADYLEYLDWARRKNDKIRQQKRSDAFYREMGTFGHGEWWK